MQYAMLVKNTRNTQNAQKYALALRCVWRAYLTLMNAGPRAFRVNVHTLAFGHIV